MLTTRRVAISHTVCERVDFGIGYIAGSNETLITTGFTLRFERNEFDA